jgi:isopenicillin-N epimerase
MDFRADFDLDPSLIYLNGGTHSICPRAVNDAVERERRVFERNPTQGIFGAWERLWAVQSRLAAHFHADPRDLFIRTNVAEALNEFIHGIPLPATGEVLVSSLEYGAVALSARRRAERSGLAFREFNLPARPARPDEPLAAVLSALRAETRLLVVSDVMTPNGLVLPVRELARETRRRGILLAVDGAHGAGSLPLDFRELEDVDFYGGNLHKWFMAPKGTAFGWVPRRHQEAVEPRHYGWMACETPPVFAAFGGGSRFAARFLAIGGRDFAPWYAIADAVEYWEARRARIAELQRRVEALADAELGWEKASPDAGPARGPLLSYYLPEKLAAMGWGLMHRLRAEKGVQVSTPLVNGRGVLRLSPHVWNSEEELERAVASIREMAAEG